MRTQRATNCAAFTLIELLVVIAMIALVMGVTLPSIMAIFTSGADAQAYNLLSAQLIAARALAIQRDTYAGVHVQMAIPANFVKILEEQDATKSLDDPLQATDCYSAVMVLNTEDNEFYLAEGFRAMRVPGGLAFGQIDGFVDDDKYENLDDPNIMDFTCFTIVFSPDGSPVRSIEPGTVVDFYRNENRGDPNYPSDPFVPDNPQADDELADQWLWDHDQAQGEPPVMAVTMFTYRHLIALPEDQRDNYLNVNGQFLPVNVYTGQLMERR